MNNKTLQEEFNKLFPEVKGCDKDGLWLVSGKRELCPSCLKEKEARDKALLLVEKILEGIYGQGVSDTSNQSLGTTEKPDDSYPNIADAYEQGLDLGKQEGAKEERTKILDIIDNLEFTNILRRNYNPNIIMDMIKEELKKSIRKKE